MRLTPGANDNRVNGGDIMNTEKLMRSQSGQILMYTTIIVMLAALILVPLMEFAFTSHRSAQIREERTLELYASDAGIEDALYQIKTEKKGTDLANLGFGNTSYNPGTPGMNDRTMDVSVQKVWIPQDLPGNLKTDQPTTGTDKSSDLVVVGMLSTIQATAASDDFSSGWTGSGSGNWAGSWGTTGSVTVNSTEGCNGNSLKLADVPSTATRTVNLLKYMKPQLKFNAKASSLEYGDTVDLNVKYGNSTWETVETWADGNETSSCEAFSIDLYDLYGWVGGSTSVPLQIEFDANFSTQATATDDFSSGTWTGGSGWYTSTGWTPSGSASVVNTGNPHSDSWHVQLSGAGSVSRQVKLASGTTPEITVWAKQNSFGSDTVTLQVSTQPNPTTWTNLNPVWNSSFSSSYTPRTYNLSTYAGQTIWIRFLGAMSTSGTTIASDGFESGWPSSGTGWAGSWTTSTSGNGAVGVVTGYARSGGTRSLQLSRSGSSAGTASATRVVNVSGRDSVQLQYYARSRNIESSGDNLFLQVSPDNVNWTSTTIIGNTTSYNSSYSSFTYTVPQSLLTTGLLYVRFYASMTRNSGESNDDYFYIDDIKLVYFPCFYFDDVSVTHAVETEGDSFYVDNLWIGDEYNSDTIEIAYTDPNFDPTTGSPGINDPAYLDRIGVWMPPGCHYVNVVGNQTTVELYKEPPTTILSDTYAGGTIVEWDYGNVALHQPSGQLPIVKTLTFTYEVDVAQSVEGMFTWLAIDRVNNGPPNLVSDPLDDYISWDKGYEIYKAVSQAHSQIYGTNTQVTAYASQGEVNKTNAASYGDYVATGNALLIDYTGSSQVKEKVINPSDPYTWVTKDGFLYDGRSDITSIASDAEVVAGWLYWSAFMNNSDWGTGNSSFGYKVTTGNVTASFMYPKRYPTESFSVIAGNVTSRTYIVNSYKLASPEPMDLLAHEPVLTLSNMRYLGESLGTLTLPHGNVTFFTAHKPISPSPAPSVKVGGVLKSQSGNYTINYDTGNVTITNPNLSGAVIIDYTVTGPKTLVRNTDYTIISDTLGQDTKYKGFTITNSDITLNKLQGTVTIDYYYAKHWENLTHAAYDKYGTSLSPAQTEVTTPSDGHVGHSYACFDDVTQLLTGNGAYDFIGKGQYAVGNVQATPGVDNSDWATRSFSGWSLIVLYKSASETAHQFYLYDPIHNAADCPFQVRPVTDFSPQPEYINVPFTLSNFYPPEGTVEGRLTYFVGEGDEGFPGDSVGFKGASQPSYTYLSGVNNPQDNVMNTVSTTGEMGIDIDTYPILDEVGSDTQANVNLRTQGDRWYLVYMILSFKTNEVPKAEYAFNVASVTYQYELGGK